MRVLLWAALTWITVPANATLIQVDFQGTLPTDLPQHWTPPGERPSHISTSFVIDTGAATSSYLISSTEVGTCVQEVRSTASGYMLSATADEMTLAPQTAGTVAIGGNRMNGCKGELGSFDSWISFESEGYRFALTLEPSIPLGIVEVFSSPDPLAFVLLEFGKSSWAQLNLSGPWGSGLAWSSQSTPNFLSIREVPEPGTLSLIAIGLVGMCFTRRKSTTQAH